VCLCREGLGTLAQKGGPKVISMEESRDVVTPDDWSTETPAAVTVFVCVNCARPSQAPTSAGRPLPVVPDFGWPWPVKEVLVPCTGRLQPEQILKALESGSDLVCAVACQEDNCHYLEGSKRCARRMDHIRSILEEIGLGGERLMLFYLPGTAAADMALAAGRPASACTSEAVGAMVAGIRDQVMQALQDLAPNPLHEAPVAETAGYLYQEVDTSDDNSEESACPDADLQPAGYHG
jgi:coenzyme F420-reducing hydrogenase delta subunit